MGKGSSKRFKEMESQLSLSDKLDSDMLNGNLPNSSANISKIIGCI